MGVFYVLGIGFTIWMAVEAVRRGHASSWLWIILVFPPIGAAVYFFSEYVEAPLGRASFHARRVTAADLRRAEADVRRLDNAATWYGYASALRGRREFTKAVEAAQRAVEHDPEDPNVRYELGLALLEAGRPKEAVAALGAVVARDRSFDSDDALFALARAQQQAGDLEAARTSLEQLAGRRGRPEILYDLATLQGRLGDREAAAQSLQRIIHEAEYVPAYLQRNVRPWVRRARQGLRKLGF